jgi:hypothetical protein
MDLSEELRAQIVELARRDRLAAVLALRRALGWGLEEAVRWLKAAVPVVAPAGEIAAAVYAFGPFDPALADCLDYPAEYYAGTRPGAVISVLVCDALGDEAVERLAEALGIDRLDLATHALDPAHWDLERLEAEDLVTHSAACLARLHAAGFRFHFDLRSPAVTSAR